MTNHTNSVQKAVRIAFRLACVALAFAALLAILSLPGA